MATNKKSARRATATLDKLSAQSSRSTSASIAWEAPEFQYYEKGWIWIAGLIGLAVIFMVIFLLMKDYSAMAVVALAAVVFYQQSSVKPRMLRYRVDERGFQLGDEMLRWNDLRSFWLSAGADRNPHLYLEPIGGWLPVKTIHLANVDPIELRERLGQYLPERATRGAALTDLLIHWLKL